MNKNMTKKNIIKLLIIFLLVSISILIHHINNPKEDLVEGKISVWFYTNTSIEEIQSIAYDLDSDILIIQNLTIFDVIGVSVSTPDSKSEEEVISDFQKYPQVKEARRIRKVQGIGPVRSMER